MMDLLNGYTFSMPHDTYGSASTVDPYECTDSNDPPTLDGIVIDRHVIAQWVCEQIRTCNALREAKTVMITSDNRTLQDIPYWRFTSRFLVQRTQWVGPRGDSWFLLAVPAEKFQVHYCWISVFIAELVAFFKPSDDVILVDTDAPVLTLFEVPDLVNLLLNSYVPLEFCAVDPAMIVITEAASRANAGVVIAPRTPRAMSVSPKEVASEALLHTLVMTVTQEELAPNAGMAVCKTEDHDPLLSKPPTLRELCSKVATSAIELLDRWLHDLSARRPHNSTLSKPVNEYSSSDIVEVLQMIPKYADKSLLCGSPLLRCQALDRLDLFAAWTLLGRVMHRVCIPSAFLGKRDLFDAHLAESLSSRRPSLVRWAGPAFEQTALQALIAIHSEYATVMELPGDGVFMEKFLPDLDQYFPAVWMHAFGENAKHALRRLERLDFFFTLREVLTPALLAGKKILPLFLRKRGIKVGMGFTMSCFAEPQTYPFFVDPGWSKQDAYNVCNRVLTSIAAFGSEWKALVRPQAEDSSEPRVPYLTVSLKKLLISCPGLRSSSIPGAESPDILFMNCHDNCSYGSTLSNPETSVDGMYKLPLYPTATLNDLMILLNSLAVGHAFREMGLPTYDLPSLHSCPSWLRLPSSSFYVAVSLLFCSLCQMPCDRICTLLGLVPPLSVKRIIDSLPPTPIRSFSIVSFSAGVHTAAALRAFMLWHGSSLCAELVSCALGSLALRPLLLLDGFSAKGVPIID